MRRRTVDDMAVGPFATARPSPPRPRLGPVLVADHDDSQVTMVTGLLERETLGAVGHVLAARPDFAAAALATQISTTNPRVVVIDVRPPLRDWWAALDGLRAQGAFQDRVVILTATNARQVRELAAGARQTLVLDKPYDLRLLVDLIRMGLRTLAANGARA